MPSFSQLLTSIQSYAYNFTSTGSLSKKIATLAGVVIGLIWMYRRIERARANERRARTALRDAHGNIMPTNIALNQHQPSPQPLTSNVLSSTSSSTSSSSEDVRKLSPSDRYLTERGGRGRRQSVCLVITPTPTNSIYRPTVSSNQPESPTQLDTSATTFTFQDTLIPILMSLSQHTTLHFICVESNKDRQAAILNAIKSIDLYSFGLKSHRVLFCMSSKGKMAMIRHIEPNLCMDEDKNMLTQLKPFLDQVVVIDSQGKSGVEGGIPTVKSIPEFFLPDVQKSKSQ